MGWAQNRARCPKTPFPRMLNPQVSIDCEWIKWSHPPGLNRRPADYESLTHLESIV
jgi:hypothetical protein